MIMTEEKTNVTMFEKQCKITSKLIRNGYGCVNIVYMPRKTDKYNFLNSTVWEGFEVHKKESQYLKELLTDLDITFKVTNRGKGKRKFDFLVVTDECFETLYNKLDEIPVVRKVTLD